MFYSRQEIDAYIEGALRFIGPVSNLTAAKTRLSSANLIGLLPVWQQVIMIEAGKSNIAGDSQTVNTLARALNLKQDVNGFFQSGDLTYQFKKAGVDNVAPNPIVWQLTGRGLSGLVTALHEQSHRNDWLLNRTALPGADGFYSDTNREWRQALESVYRKSASERPATTSAIVNWIEERLKDGLAGAVPADDPPYPDYRDLADHLSYYPSTDDHPREAFAEMNNHYLNIYVAHGGDQTRVDETLTRLYPDLWPVYRDGIIPQLERYAHNLIAAKMQKIDTFIDLYKYLHPETDPQRDDELRARALLESAKGTLDLTIRHLDGEKHLLINPATFFVDAQYNLYVTRNAAGVAFNFTKAYADCGLLLARLGKQSVIALYRGLVEEENVLTRFIVTRKRVAAGLGEQSSTSSLLEQFDVLKADGGIERVKDDILAQPGDIEIDRYSDARRDLWRERKLLQNLESGWPADLKKTIAAEIKDLLRIGGRGALMQKTIALDQELLALQDYFTVKEQTASIIAQVTGHKPACNPAWMLAAFDALVASGGPQAAEDIAEQECHRVDAKRIRAYAEARENWEATHGALCDLRRNAESFSWSRHEGLYRPLECSGLPADFQKRLADEIRALLDIADPDILRREADRLNQETHLAIAGLVEPMTITGTTADQTDRLRQSGVSSIFALATEAMVNASRLNVSATPAERHPGFKPR